MSTGSTPESVDDIDRTQHMLRDQALARIGVTGDDRTERFRDLMRQHDLRIYPLAALGILSVVDTFFTFAQGVLTPEISRSLGLSTGAIATVFAVQGLALALAPLPMSVLSQRTARRALLCLVTAFLWSVLTIYSGFVTSVVGLAVVLALNGLTSGSVSALHPPLIMDSYHPHVRVRVMSAYTAITTAGSIAAPLLIVVMASAFDLTWRGVFLVLGLLSILGSTFALGLRDPGFGAWDTEQIRRTVRACDSPTEDLRPEDVSLGIWEICRRLMMIPTVKRLLAGYLIVGVLTVPLATFFAFFLERQWDLGPEQRAYFVTYQSAVAIVALMVFGGRGETLFRRDPAKVLRAAGVLLALALVCIAAGALSPTLWGVVVAFGLSSALMSVLTPSLSVGALSIVPAVMRPHLSALAGIFIAIGGISGAVFLGSIESRFGITGAIVVVIVPGVIGALVIASAAAFIRGDLERMVDEVIEDETIKKITASGHRLPLLAVRGVDFSYGQVQVLFDVDLTVDEGEMVALLGVNGAGKSTLLKVISGIALPSKGTVRFRGQDITYVDAERRVRLGITQISGGRAVFGPMTVEENLRSFGHSLGRDRRRLEARVDECYELFPQLLARRTQPSATLSGGEQHMLALSRAFILRPRVLVIDELSLGLAPAVVGQLLETVRRVNAAGTTVVLVEQSVNLALSLADHAYFMEKGGVRFDGSGEELLAQEELLRAVFLKGVAEREGAHR
ncbi:MFS transporter [Streptomyces sp. NPDC002285]